MEIKVSKMKCPQSHKCPAIKVCPADAIKQEGYKAPVIDLDKCIVCKKCVMYCPMGAIEAV